MGGGKTKIFLKHLKHFFFKMKHGEHTLCTQFQRLERRGSSESWPLSWHIWSGRWGLLTFACVFASVSFALWHLCLAGHSTPPRGRDHQTVPFGIGEVRNDWFVYFSLIVIINTIAVIIHLYIIAVTFSTVRKRKKTLLPSHSHSYFHTSASLHHCERAHAV